MQKKLGFAKFRKSQEAIWLTVINEIFQLPPHFDAFSYENYLDEPSLGSQITQLKNDTFRVVFKLLE